MKKLDVSWHGMLYSTLGQLIVVTNKETFSVLRTLKIVKMY